MFSIEARPLADAIARCVALADRRSPIPIVRTVRIVARDQRVTLTAVSMSVLARIDIALDADAADDFAACLPMDDFGRWAAALPSGGQVTAEIDYIANRASMTCGRFRHTFATLPTEDFPELHRLAKFHRGQAVEALKVATMGRAGPVSLSSGKSLIEISHKRQGREGGVTGDATADFDAEVHGEFRRTMDARYLIAALESLPEGDVTWSASGMQTHLFETDPGNENAPAAVVMGLRDKDDV